MGGRDGERQIKNGIECISDRSINVITKKESDIPEGIFFVLYRSFE